MEVLASGSERSTTGIPLKKVAGGLHVLIREKWSNAGLDRTTITFVCFLEKNREKKEEKEEGVGALV